MVRLSLPARRILAYLALRRGCVGRSSAVAELWPDLPEDLGRANLRRSLWNAPRGWIVAGGEELALEAETDIAAAEAVASGAIEGAALTLDEIRLLSNDILPGWHEEWLLPIQDEFHLLRVHALEQACRTLIASNDLTLAIVAGSAALAAEPLRESTAEALIDAHLAQRNRFDAVRCFRSLAKRLETELGVAPNAELAARVQPHVGASVLSH